VGIVLARLVLLLALDCLDHSTLFECCEVRVVAGRFCCVGKTERCRVFMMGVGYDACCDMGQIASSPGLSLLTPPSAAYPYCLPCGQEHNGDCLAMHFTRLS